MYYLLCFPSNRPSIEFAAISIRKLEKHLLPNAKANKESIVLKI